MLRTCGNSVTGFSLATNRKRGDDDLTTWWRCSCWGKRGEALAQYVGKGDPVLVVGEPYQREWTDQNGQTRLSMEVDVRDWSFVSTKADRQAAPSAPAAPSDHDVDVPF